MSALSAWKFLFTQVSIVQIFQLVNKCFMNTFTNKLNCDCNWTWTHNHLVSKQTLNHLAKLT